nr:hypothetical protein [uncultured Mediterranean phage uvMED]
MGSNSSSGGGSGGNTGPDAGFFVAEQRKKEKKPADYNPEKDDSSYYKTRDFETAGAEKIKKGVKTPSLAVNAAVAILSKPLQAGSIKTRQFFRKDVLGKGAYKTTSQSDFDAMSRSAQESMYKSYITGRTSGKTDAYGRTINQSDNGGGNQVVQAPVQKVEELPQQVKAPESVMTSEEARAKANLLLKKKRGTRTKSSLIATSSQGITDDEGLTLGQKSLLG